MVANLMPSHAEAAQLATKPAGSTRFDSATRRKYQRLGPQMISPLIWYEGESAFDVARRVYAKYSKLNFFEDFMHYLRSGFVVTRPNLFVMGKPIVVDERRGWFIQMACGQLGEILSVVPVKLDFFAFCRNNDDNMRVIEWDHFVKKVGAKYGWRQ